MKAFAWVLKNRPPIASQSGWICFQIGLFFLASSPLIAGFLLLIALVQGSLYRGDSYWKDKWNYPLLIAAFLMISGCFKAFSGWLAWVGLANWLPFFWCFWGFQPYLLTAIARKRCAFWFVVGTFPVLLTGFGQLWLGWQGPWEFLDGLIIWFIDPGGKPEGRLSGLFNYANIAGSWLALIWPFCLAFLIKSSTSFRNRSVSLLFAVSVGAALVLTNSRNAWSGMVLAVPFVLGPSTWFVLLPLLSLLVLVVGLAVLPIASLELQLWARRIVPESIWFRLSDMSEFPEETGRALETMRLFQWKEAINLFIQRPLLGYGAAAFSVLYPLRQGIWHGHAHNLPLELTVAHGLPVAVLIVGIVLALLIKSFKTCFSFGKVKSKASNNLDLFDRAWWTATFILVFLHASDMPFFDSRINIAGWILLAGLRCLIMSSDSLNKLHQYSVDGAG